MKTKLDAGYYLICKINGGPMPPWERTIGLKINRTVTANLVR